MQWLFPGNRKWKKERGRNRKGEEPIHVIHFNEYSLTSGELPYNHKVNTFSDLLLQSGRVH